MPTYKLRLLVPTGGFAPFNIDASYREETFISRNDVSAHGSAKRRLKKVRGRSYRLYRLVRVFK